MRDVHYEEFLLKKEKYNSIPLIEEETENFKKIPQKKKEKRRGHDLELYNRAMKKREFRMMVYNNRFGKKLKMEL